MYRIICASLLFSASIATAPAYAFPTAADTAMRIPLEICYDLSVETTPLGSTSPDDAVSLSRVPFCVDFRGFFDVAAGQAACNIPSSSSPNCSYKSLNPGGYVSIKTSRFTFQARTVGGLSFSDNQAASTLGLSSQFYVQTNWDYRINQILAHHRDELDVRLASLVLPSVTFDDERGMRLHTNFGWAGSAAPFAISAGRTTMQPIDGIGYDADNREYDVRIWIEQGTAAFAAP